MVENQGLRLIYAAKLKDINLRMESQSGGAFTAIAECFIRHGASVYGCGLNEHNEATYMRITDLNSLKLIKGSKYVQAQVNDVFQLIEKDLNNNMLVLFSGTPCYVAAVKKYFSGNKNYRLLYTADLICHGVPSRKIYRDYLNLMEDRFGSKIMKFDFRFKNGGVAPTYGKNDF